MLSSTMKRAHAPMKMAGGDSTTAALPDSRVAGVWSAALWTLLALAMLLATGGSLTAQTRQIEERHPLRADATVDISAIIHSITVERWDRNEIEIRGEYDAEWEEITVRPGESNFRFEVDALQRNRRNGNWNTSRSRSLTVRVPEGVRLNVASVSGEIAVRRLTGPVTAASVSGSVEVEGGGPEARLNSVSGGVTYTGNASEVDAQSVSGRVRVTTTAAVSSATIRSVSGGVHFEGGLARGGRLSVESHSGGAELILPRDVDARFSLSTFSGRVSSDLPGGQDEVMRRGRHVPQESLTFTTGGGSGRVDAKSFSGNVRVRPAGR